MKIAVSGKGGVGKTTVSAHLARMLTKIGYKVYAVDADPDTSLGLALGLDEDTLSTVKPIIEMREVIAATAGDGAFFKLNPNVKELADKFSIDIDGIKFLKMGGVKQGGSECYCRENTFLKAIVNSLLLDSDEVVILDMGAGIEHLTRGTAAKVDVMIIVTEAGKSSVATARIVEKLANDLKIKNIKFIANKIRNLQEESFINEHFNQQELIGIIHYNDMIAQKSMGIIPSGEQNDDLEIENILKKVINI